VVARLNRAVRTTHPLVNDATRADTTDVERLIVPAVLLGSVAVASVAARAVLAVLLRMMAAPVTRVESTNV
jgi:hypothetical protein